MHVEETEEAKAVVPGELESLAEGPGVRYITAGGVRARLIEYGEGEPILLIHGVGGWAEYWRDTLPALANAGFKAIACDLPGFGRSEQPRDVRYLDPKCPYYVTFIHDVLDVLSLSRVSVVGHSLGGTIAAASAALMPARVQRLALVAPGGFGPVRSPRLRLFSIPFTPQLARFTPDALIRDFIRSNFSDPTRIPAWLYEEATLYGRAGGTEELARVLSQILPSRAGEEALRRAWQQRMSNIQCPTLVAWGMRDRTMPSMHADAVREFLPHARLELFEDTGHMPMVERAAEFNRMLLSFLDSSTLH